MLPDTSDSGSHLAAAPLDAAAPPRSRRHFQ